MIVFGGHSVQAADFKLTSIFSDGMVIQRNQPVAVWGEGNPGAEVEVRLDTQIKKATVSSNGHWQIMLNPIPVGGPYTLKASTPGTTTTVRDVLSGDVWLCAGQSNMQMAVKECHNAAKVLAVASQYTKLRFLDVPKGGADQPSASMGGKWQSCTPQTAADFSAIGYFFGTELLKDPVLADVPMGLIDSSFGGTAVEGWIPAAGILGIPPDQMSPSMFNLGPSTLYNGMIAPLVPCGLSGVLWYQGEANAGKPERYEHLLSTLILQWRQAWTNPALPFFIVQLPPYSGKSNGNYFTWLREAQAKVAQTVAHTGLAITIDTCDGSNLHPTLKQVIGKRLALLARRDVYREKIIAEGPIETRVEIHDSRVRVNFNTAGKALVSRGGDDLSGFSVAGSDGIYQFANATIDGDGVILQSDLVPEPKTVRYAWAGVPEADLYNSDGLPAAPFRTDTLPVKNLEFYKEPATYRLDSPSYEITIDGRGKVTGLGVLGRQFLANGFGMSGGTSLPGFFGPRDLPMIKELAPNCISCSDNDATLKISCEDNSMEWDLRNNGDKEIPFSIALAPWVDVSQLGNEIDLVSGDARLKIEAAFEISAPSQDGRKLTVKVTSHKDAILKFRVVPKQ